jgi:hypothetical protein
LAVLLPRLFFSTWLIRPLTAAFLYLAYAGHRYFTKILIAETNRFHETFHTNQGTAAGGSLEAAERANQRHEAAYPREGADFVEAWQIELDLLLEE